MKTCTKCDGVFPATTKFFHKCPSKKDGFRCRCKTCTNKDGRVYKNNHREEIKIQTRQYRQDNPEKVAAQQKAYRDRIRAAKPKPVIEQNPTKTCTKCNKDLPATPKFFYRSKGGKYGIGSWCKTCRKKHDGTESGKLIINKASAKYEHTEKGQRAKLRTATRYCQTWGGYLQGVYKNIRARCNNPNNKSYKYYGGRGIKNLFTSLDEFRAYVRNVLKLRLYSQLKGRRIDRIDVDGNYEPGNIRWVSHKESNVNRRKFRGC